MEKAITYFKKISFTFGFIISKLLELLGNSPSIIAGGFLLFMFNTSNADSLSLYDGLVVLFITAIVFLSDQSITLIRKVEVLGFMLSIVILIMLAVNVSTVFTWILALILILLSFRFLKKQKDLHIYYYICLTSLLFQLVILGSIAGILKNDDLLNKIVIILAIQLFFYFILSLKKAISLDEQVDTMNLVIAFLLIQLVSNWMFGLYYTSLADKKHDFLYYVVTLKPLYIGYAVDTSLPIMDKTLSEELMALNTDSLLWFIQILHKSLSKIIDLFIFGFIASRFLDRIQRKDKSISV